MKKLVKSMDALLSQASRMTLSANAGVVSTGCFRPTPYYPRRHEEEYAPENGDDRELPLLQNPSENLES